MLSPWQPQKQILLTTFKHGQKKEPTIEKKLRALYDLQLIDSRIDEIISLRGELPLEVEDLENEIKELKTKSDKIKAIVEENKKESLNKNRL